MILREMSLTGKTSKRVPNAEIILDLISKVEKHPDLWASIVGKVNDIAGYAESWKLADDKLVAQLAKPHRSSYRAWLDFQLQDAKRSLVDSHIKNAWETLESACEALVVYDSVTPPRHGPTSEKVMSMKPEEVKYRATRVPVGEDNKSTSQPEEATPLLLVARAFVEAVKKIDGENGTSDELEISKIDDEPVDNVPLDDVKSFSSELTPDAKKLAEAFKSQFFK